MKTMRTGIWAVAALLAAAGCSMTREIRTYEQLREAAPRPIRVMDKDCALYELSTFTVLDSVLEGSGTRLADGVRSPFRGTLPYRNLVYIQARDGGYWRTIEILGIAAVVASSLSRASENHGLSVYSAGGNSCPYVYAWDGDAFALQGEAFGTSFGKALEAQTVCMLPAARAQDGVLHVRLTNERPETHYVNRVRLLAFETPEGSTVCVDGEDRAWPIVAPCPPLRSSPELKAKDEVYWSSDPDAVAAGSGYRDRLDLVFARPDDGVAASVIVHAVNTNLVYSTYALVFGYLGDQTLPFLYQVEHDPQLIETLKSWIRECSLTVELCNDGQWEISGAIAPEASVAPFSRLVRIDGSGATDSLRIRLSSLADGWRIDAVEIDWTPAAPLEGRPMAMIRADHSDGTSLPALLRETDARYGLLLPGERIDMSFAACGASGGGQIAYGLEVGGFLHEWPPEPDGTQPGSALAAFASLTASASPATLGRAASSVAPDRVAVVNHLVRHPELLLPLVYQHWKERRERLPG